MFDLHSSVIPGCFEIRPRIQRDGRGLFENLVQQSLFKTLGLQADFVEQYYSRSFKGVLRGLHFQVPPHDQVKLVYCLEGTVFDAVVDLRTGSPTYGKFDTFELDCDSANMVYLPKGLAHGFWVLSERATLVYNVTSEYAPEHDQGLLWHSAGIPWPGECPLLSPRDEAFPPLEVYQSPFSFPMVTHV